jgi:hypothetical protein
VCEQKEVCLRVLCLCCRALNCSHAHLGPAQVLQHEREEVLGSTNGRGTCTDIHTETHCHEHIHTDLHNFPTCQARHRSTPGGRVAVPLGWVEWDHRRNPLVGLSHRQWAQVRLRGASWGFQWAVAWEEEEGEIMVVVVHREVTRREVGTEETWGPCSSCCRILRQRSSRVRYHCPCNLNPITCRCNPRLSFSARCRVLVGVERRRPLVGVLQWGGGESAGKIAGRDVGKSAGVIMVTDGGERIPEATDGDGVWEWMGQGGGLCAARCLQILCLLRCGGLLRGDSLRWVVPAPGVLGLQLKLF